MERKWIELKDYDRRFIIPTSDIITVELFERGFDRTNQSHMQPYEVIMAVATGDERKTYTWQINSGEEAKALYSYIKSIIGDNEIPCLPLKDALTDVPEGD